jgi:radical SAM protein with 4Fe4S-binding SPASM domain
MRNSNQFDQIVKNLRSFVDRISHHPLSQPKLSLWYLGTRENIAELPDFIRLAASIGVREVYLQRLVYFLNDDGYGVATSEKTLMDSDDKTRELVNQSQALAKQLDIQFNASGMAAPLESVRTDPADRSSWKKCFRPKTLMYITANGNVLPCCISPFSTSDYSSIVLGNVFESGLEEIWLGSRYQGFRKTHQTDTPPKCCRGCGIFWSL